MSANQPGKTPQATTSRSPNDETSIPSIQSDELGFDFDDYPYYDDLNQFYGCRTRNYTKPHNIKFQPYYHCDFNSQFYDNDPYPPIPARSSSLKKIMSNLSLKGSKIQSTTDTKPQTFEPPIRRPPPNPKANLYNYYYYYDQTTNLIKKEMLPPGSKPGLLPPHMPSAAIPGQQPPQPRLNNPQHVPFLRPQTPPYQGQQIPFSPRQSTPMTRPTGTSPPSSRNISRQNIPPGNQNRRQ